jgi:hypothetical protein
MSSRTMNAFALLVVTTLGFGASRQARAGPPFSTDDPEPVQFRHWEIYLASQSQHSMSGWSGTAPHFELNYGALPNVQVHLIVPLAYAAPRQGVSQYGFGDMEVGAKVRFLQETEGRPQVGTFVILDLPTGNSSRGLGEGNTRVFLPLWVQKSFGAWTTYGGGGYWINPGSGNRNYLYLGWLLQRQLSEWLAVGVETFHTTPSTGDNVPETRFNVGAVIDLSKTQHILWSAGRGIQGPNRFQTYVAVQLTL